MSPFRRRLSFSRNLKPPRTSQSAKLSAWLHLLSSDGRMLGHHCSLALYVYRACQSISEQTGTAQRVAISSSTSLPVTIAPWGDTAPALSRGQVRNISAPSCESAYGPSTVCRDLVSRPCETKKVPSQPLHTAALLEKEEKESACVEDYG